MITLIVTNLVLMHITILCSSFWESFWPAFLPSVAATLVGVAVGVPIALWINRIFESRIDKKEKIKSEAEAKNKEITFLNLFKDSLVKNKDLLLQIQKEIKTESATFSNLDLHLLDATASAKYEVISDQNLNQEIDSIRYKLHVIFREMEMQLESVFSVSSYSKEFIELRKNLIKELNAGIPQLFEDIKNCQKSIENRLELLSKVSQP